MSVSATPDAELAGFLSDTTLAALQLRQQPFSELPADGDLFADETTAEQLADVKQALITGDDLLLVLGEPGSGRSTLLAQLGANSGLRIQCFSVSGSTRFSTQNLFAGMLEAFKQAPLDDLKDTLDALVPCLQGMVGNNILSAVVLDDADQVSDGELTRLLSSMLYLNSQDETLFRVALAANDAFESRIPELLPEGADLPYSSLSVEPFNDERAAAYLEFRLNQAGYFDAFPFDDDVIEAMNERAGGRPRDLHVEAARELEAHAVSAAQDDSMPAELLSKSGRGTFGSRGSKLALGSVALAFILGGLLISRDDTPGEEAPGYTVVEQRPLTTERTGDLNLIDGSGDDRGDAANDTRDAETAEASDVAADGAEQGETGSAADASVPGEPEDGDVVALAPQSDDAADSAPSTDGGDGPVSAAPDPSAPQPASETSPEVSPGTDAPVEADPEPEPTPFPEPEPEPEPAPIPEPEPEPEPEAVSEPVPELLPPADAPPDADGQRQDNLESATWILTQDATLFTVQMSASTERGSVENFLARNDLDAPNSIFAFDRDGTTWYALVHGLFSSIEDARLAVERMPVEAQSNQPWIRSVGRIQAVLKDQG